VVVVLVQLGPVHREVVLFAVDLDAGVPLADNVVDAAVLAGTAAKLGLAERDSSVTIPHFPRPGTDLLKIQCWTFRWRSSFQVETSRRTRNPTLDTLRFKKHYQELDFEIRFCLFPLL
jgi:hypothetical protein